MCMIFESFLSWRYYSEVISVPTQVFDILTHPKILYDDTFSFKILLEKPWFEQWRLDQWLVTVIKQGGFGKKKQQPQDILHASTRDRQSRTAQHEVQWLREMVVVEKFCAPAVDVNSVSIAARSTSANVLHT